MLFDFISSLPFCAIRNKRWVERKGIIKPISFTFGANLKVVDGKIEVCDFALNSKNTNYGAFLPIINKLNPTSWKMNIDNDNEGKLEVESVKIANSQIEVVGYIIVEKNK